MRIHLRTKHYSIRTEDAYVGWARRYILFHHKRHLSAMGAPEINDVLSFLAVERDVSAPGARRSKREGRPGSANDVANSHGGAEGSPAACETEA
jgi:hypothetical protein